MKKKPLQVAGALAGLIFCIAIINNTFQNGWDFNVFWQAARLNWTGKSPYFSEMGPWVYKYPPWSMPLFLPFAVFPYDYAKLLWGVTEVVALIYSLRVLLNWGLHRGAIVATVLSFWFLISYHALAGQVMLPLLALILWSVRKGREPRWENQTGMERFESAFLVIALSMKIFSFVSLFAVLKSLLNRRVIGFTLLLLCVLSLPTLLVTKGFNPFWMIHEWIETAGSGGHEWGDSIVRGRYNQGLPAALLRWVGVDSRQTEADLAAFVLFACLFGGAWAFLSRRFSFQERFSGWLGLGVAIHPLAWFHSFVWAIPLCAVTLDRVFKRRERVPQIISLMAIACTCWITRVTLGRTVGSALELASIKAIGVCLFLVALVVSHLKHSSRVRD